MADTKGTLARKTAAHVAAEKRIIELEKALAEATRMKEYYSKEASEQKTIVDGIHDVLTDMGIKEYRDETNRYTKIPLTVRLFSWAMSLANKP